MALPITQSARRPVQGFVFARESPATRSQELYMIPIVLLIVSNVFMTFAWYYHLKNPYLKTAPIWAVIVVSWAIAFFEYCFQVPGNRIGYNQSYTAGQLKV